MPEILIESVLTGKTDPQLLLKWLNSESLEDTPEDSVLFCCSRSEFVAYFLSYLRDQTDSILQSNSNVLPLPQYQNTPEKAISTRRKHRRSTSDPTKDRPTDKSTDSLSVKTDKQRSHESPSRDKKKQGRRVKTKLFNDDSLNQSVSSDESRLSSGVDRLILSSTPLKNGFKASDYPLTSPVITHKGGVSNERCDTPRLGRHTKSQEKSCLGDYLVISTKSSKKKRGDKNVSTDSEKKDKDNSDGKVDLDLSNSDMFPEIGARKASSLKADRRRIKPTNLDTSMSQKSFSLNSFNSDTFQQPSPLALEENLALQQEKFQPKELSLTNSFESERSMLKQERHKLMEKFNILNTNTTNSSPRVSTPQIKLPQNISSGEKKQNTVKAEIAKVLFKEKIEILVEIYDVLMKNNFILSVNTEIYFLISILLSKQNEDECNDAENELNSNKVTSNLLKSIHNSTYFAVKSLWSQRCILEMILDKTSLKTLGENKKVRGFFPDLAKFLLNSYGIKCENGVEKPRCQAPEVTSASNSVVCFNFETDNTENFPSVLSFQNFKKQRDMFYEIMRWYNETQTAGGTRSTFRARIKTLITCGNNPTNHSHLTGLFTKQMLLDCPSSSIEESKLSKLQRRLTCPTAQESNRLPHFTAKETFYKEFIMYAENESFRVHLRDALASEIIALDNTPLVNEDKNSNSSDTTKDFLQLSTKLRLLSKFLGFLSSLPYCQPALVVASKTNVTVKEKHYTMPKEKVLENNVALRNYSQPSMNLRSLLDNSIRNSRTTITVPWITHYLSMLDYSTLRIDYYRQLIERLFDVYVNLKNDFHKKPMTVLYLKSTLGWLFDLPHFPLEFFYDYFSQLSAVAVASDSGCAVDAVHLLDEAGLFELCPFLKDVNVLLSTCKVSQEKSIGSFRHITPVSLTLNPEDRIRNKEKELQARLEEQLLKSLPSSSRRVLELVTERTVHRCVRELAGQLLQDSTLAARCHAADVIHARRHQQANLLQAIQAVYNEHLEQMRTKAMQMATLIIKDRTGSALSALLPNAPAPVLALVVKTCLSRLKRWMQDNWSSTAILCKDIESEMKTLMALGPLATSSSSKNVVNNDFATLPNDEFERQNVSVAQTIINLKEQVCVLLSQESSGPDTAVLGECVSACELGNVFCRAPARQAALQLSTDLAFLYVCRRPKEVNEELLAKFYAIWHACCPDRKRSISEDLILPSRRDLTPEPRNFDDDQEAHDTLDSCQLTQPSVSQEDCSIEESASEQTDSSVIATVRIEPEPSEEMSVKKSVSQRRHCEVLKMDNSDVKVSKTPPGLLSPSFDVHCDSKVEDSSCHLLDFFNRILCPRNIVILNDSSAPACDIWEALALLLVFLLKNDFLSEDSLTEQCLAVYRQDWPQKTLESLSNCMKLVSSQWSRSAVGKFTLFLDFLAEFCGDMDIQPLDYD